MQTQMLFLHVPFKWFYIKRAPCDMNYFQWLFHFFPCQSRSLLQFCPRLLQRTSPLIWDRPHPTTFTERERKTHSAIDTSGPKKHSTRPTFKQNLKNYLERCNLAIFYLWQSDTDRKSLWMRKTPRTKQWLEPWKQTLFTGNTTAIKVFWMDTVWNSMTREIELRFTFPNILFQEICLNDQQQTCGTFKN